MECERIFKKKFVKKKCLKKIICVKILPNVLKNTVFESEFEVTISKTIQSSGSKIIIQSIWHTLLSKNFFWWSDTFCPRKKHINCIFGKIHAKPFAVSRGRDPNFEIIIWDIWHLFPCWFQPNWQNNQTLKVLILVWKTCMLLANMQIQFHKLLQIWKILKDFWNVWGISTKIGQKLTELERNNIKTSFKIIIHILTENQK